MARLQLRGGQGNSKPSEDDSARPRLGRPSGSSGQVTKAAGEVVAVSAAQELLSFPDAGIVLGVSRGTVRNMVLRGHLPVVRFLGVQRIRRVDLNALISSLPVIEREAV